MPAASRTPTPTAETPAESRADGFSRGTRPIITRTRELALRAELERLREELDVGFAARMREAREFGDASNNDDYLQIKEEREVVEARVARLESVLSSALVIDETDGDGKTVAIGATVEVEDLDTGEKSEYLMIGDFDPPAPGAASAGSPVGRALIGRTVGDEVEFELPNGKTRRLRVLASKHAA